MGELVEELVLELAVLVAVRSRRIAEGVCDRKCQDSIGGE
jgi:hypothetical protein